MFNGSGKGKKSNTLQKSSCLMARIQARYQISSKNTKFCQDLWKSAKD